MKILPLAALGLALTGSVVAAKDFGCFDWPDKLLKTATITSLSPFSGSNITVQIASSWAGAINQLTWDGFKYVNNWDIGRLFQTAMNFDGAGECYNPTEGGSRDDSTNPELLGTKSQSLLIDFGVAGNKLYTINRPANWVGPGLSSTTDCHGAGLTPGGHHFSIAPSQPSEVIMIKNVEIGNPINNVIKYTVNYLIPTEHGASSFENLAAYINPNVISFHALNSTTGHMIPLAAPQTGVEGLSCVLTNEVVGSCQIPLSTADAIIGTTTDSAHAIGIIHTDGDPRVNHYAGVFNRANRPDSRVQEACCGSKGNKINCQFQIHSIEPNSEHIYTCYLAVGSVEQVRTSLMQLRALGTAQPHARD